MLIVDSFNCCHDYPTKSITNSHSLSSKLKFELILEYSLHVILFFCPLVGKLCGYAYCCINAKYIQKGGETLPVPAFPPPSLVATAGAGFIVGVATLGTPGFAFAFPYQIMSDCKHIKSNLELTYRMFSGLPCDRDKEDSRRLKLLFYLIY